MIIHKGVVITEDEILGILLEHGIATKNFSTRVLDRIESEIPKIIEIAIETINDDDAGGEHKW